MFLAQQIELHKCFRSIPGVASSSNWHSQPRLALASWVRGGIADHPDTSDSVSPSGLSIQTCQTFQIGFGTPDLDWHPPMALALRIGLGILDWSWHFGLALASWIGPGKFEFGLALASWTGPGTP